ncbi:hypothetical protein RXP20_20350 [Pseudomonas aeruginosa]|nr:hypothetical protein [Pseudomonas aeruginosa]MEB4997362.1 hypothetical protein [Pseudomonas aeruginosa]
MKKSTLSVLAPCALLIAIAQPLVAAEKLVKVTAGHLIALDMAPLFVGVESGCFKQQGLEVDTRFLLILETITRPWQAARLISAPTRLRCLFLQPTVACRSK